MKFSSATADDLLCEVPVSFIQAALGAEIEVPTIEGRAVIKIPPARNRIRRSASKEKA